MSDALVATFRMLFSGELTFSADRAIFLDLSRPLPEKPLDGLAMALTYHRAKSQSDQRGRSPRSSAIMIR